MKNVFFVLAFLCSPVTAWAHADSHEHYGLLAFIRHFFTQPYHLAITGLLLAALVLWAAFFWCKNNSN